MSTAPKLQDPAKVDPKHYKVESENEQVRLAAMAVTKLRRPGLFIWGAWLLDAAAWFLPVVKDGTKFPEGLPGWQAFRVASCAVWPCAGVSFDAWYYALLATVSAATTLLIILVSPWVVWRGSRALQSASAWAATTAFIINAHWYVLRSERSELRIGYFLWWISFLLLAIGLFSLAGHYGADESSESPAA